jgi:hypothetical protein
MAIKRLEPDGDHKVAVAVLRQLERQLKQREQAAAANGQA